MTSEYIMRGLQISTGKHVYWTSGGAPDFSGQFAPIPPSDLSGIVIDYTTNTPVGSTGAPGVGAGGDLTGGYPNPTVARLRNILVSTTSPNINDTLTFDGTQWAPSPIPSAITLAYLNQATWFVDPANSTGLANDNNSGIDATHPVLSYNGGIVSKWKTTSPILRQNTTITWMSSQPTGGADPVILNPIMVNAVLNVVGTLPAAVHSGALSGVIVKNRATPQLLTANLGFAATPGQLVRNTTGGKDSFAWVYRQVSGTTFELSQPLTPYILPLDEVPTTTPVDTWANGDTFQVFNPLEMHLVHASGNAADFISGTFPAPVQIQRFRLASPTGFDSDNNVSIANAALVECFTNCVVDDAPDWSNDYISSIANCFLSSSVTSRNTQVSVYGGVIISLLVGSIVPWSMVYDTIVDATGVSLVLGGDVGQGTSIPVLQTVYIKGQVSYQNRLSCAEQLAPVSLIWGPGSLDGLGIALLWFHSGSAVSTFLNTGGLTLNGSTAVQSVGPVVAPVTLTPKNLDLWKVLKSPTTQAQIATSTAVPTPDFTLQAVWHINNSSGDDSNNGLTSGTAIKTCKEMSKRLGPRPYINQTVDVYIHADMAADDVLLISGQLGPLGFINYHGVPTVVHSGTLSSVTPYNAAANQGDEIADGYFDWSPYIDVDGSGAGFLVVINTGNINGPSYCWVAKQLAGPARARVSYLGQRVPGDFYDEVISPATIGNTYQIQRLPVITNVIFDVAVFTEVFQPQIMAEFLSFPIFTIPIYPFVAFECAFPEIFITATGTLWLVNTLMSGTSGVIGSVNLLLETQFGLVLNALVANNGGWIAEGLTVQNSQFFYDVLGSNPTSAMLESHHQAYGIGVFDSANPFVVGYGAKILMEAPIYGSGNTGVSFNIYGGGQILIKNPASSKLYIQNSGADIVIDGFSSLPAVDPVTFVPTASRALTIANFLAPVGSGGFGTAVFNPRFPATGMISIT